MQTVLQYLCTLILASLPPAPPSALHSARPHSSSSPPHSSPGYGGPSMARSHSKTSDCAAGCAALTPPPFPSFSLRYLMHIPTQAHTHTTPCAWRSSSPCSSTTSLHTPRSAQSSMIMSMQHLYGPSFASRR
ncbi:hypothetical protein JB92DRAFT_2938294 [Gautieria morchelliformis]|nr:hypothetical protein JB92DRAFT_2938294 [Gautieria morchelliformis]